MNKYFLHTLRSALAAALLWLVWRLELVSFGSLALLLDRPLPLMAAMLCAWTTIPLAALRWQLLLRCQGVRITLRQAFWFTWLGVFMNNFVPASLGGDMSRAVCLFREIPDAKAKGVMSLVADRLVTLLGVLLTAWVFGLALSSHFAAASFLGRTLQWICVLLALLGALALYYLLRPEHQSLTRWLERRHGGSALGEKLILVLNLLRIYRTAPGPLLLALGLSVANQLSMALSLFFLSQILGFSMLTFVVLGLSTPLSLIINMMPFSPGGIGFGEAAFANINAWILPGSVLLGSGTVFLAFRLVILLVSLPGVLHLVWDRRVQGEGQEGQCGC